MDPLSEGLLVVIPARLASRRLPGKPLLDLGGRPVVVRVLERCRAAFPGAEVVVATDALEVARAVCGAGGTAELTAEGHRSGTDRVAEIARRRSGVRVVLDVQGDEPFVEPGTLRAVVNRAAADDRPALVTAACPFPDGHDPSDPSAVKVVTDGEGRALYFSRAPIPWSRSADEGVGLPARRLHLGVYAFRPDFLQAFAATRPGRLEEAEDLEQLRALEAGVPVHVVDVAAPRLGGIDTEEDYRRALALLASTGDTPRGPP